MLLNNALYNWRELTGMVVHCKVCHQKVKQKDRHWVDPISVPRDKWYWAYGHLCRPCYLIEMRRQGREVTHVAS